MSNLPPGPGQWYYVPAPQPVVVQTSPKSSVNGLAIASMVLGICMVYWIGSILALVFGYVALNQIATAPPDRPQSGRGFAIAGIVLGWVWVGIGLLILVVAALAATASA